MKLLKQIIIVAILIMIPLGISAALAQSFIPDDPINDFTKVVDPTGLPKFEGRPHGQSSTEPGADIITTVIFNVIDFMKYLLGGIAILFITISGIQLITAGDSSDEVSKKQKNALKYIIFGLALVIVADTFVKQVLFGEYGECFASDSNAANCAKQGSLQIRGIYNFVEVFVGSIAVLMFVYSGLRLASSTGNEEVIEEQKKQMAAAVVGLVIIGLAEFVIKDVFFPAAGEALPDVGKGQLLIFKLTNFIASFVATIAIIYGVYGGYLYVMSRGEEEPLGKAKKMLLGAVIGIFIALASFAVVNTLTRLEGREGESVTEEAVIERANPSDFDTGQ